MENLASSATITRDIPEEDVVVVQLSEPNKFRLFKETTEALASQDGESAKVLKQLEKLNSNAARSFGKKEDAVSRAPFRLIFSRDSPVLTDLTREVPAYVVVSYCWHNPSWNPGHPEECTPWPFSRDLAESILDLRVSNEEGIFIDQACIDQENATEKAYAIASMNIIYRSARRMVILLEDVIITEAEEAVLDKFRTLILQGRGPDAKPDLSEKRTLATIQLKMCSSRWFSRAWCAHEFKVARHWIDTDFVEQHTFRIYNEKAGIVRVPLLLHAWIAIITNDIVRLESIAPMCDLMAQDLCYGRFQTLLEQSPVQQLSHPTENLSIAIQYARMSNLQCLIPSDRINIALNICGLGIYFKGPVETDDECWWVFILLAIARGEGSVLNCVGPALILNGSTKAYWSQSWARRPTGLYTFRDIRVPSTFGDLHITKVEQDWIELDLYFFNEPLKSPSPKFEKEAASIVESTLTAEQREDRIETWTLQAELVLGPVHVLKKGAREKFLRQIVSFCLEFGTKWMLKTAESIRHASEVDPLMQSALQDPDDSMHNLARVLLSRAKITEKNTPEFVSDFLVPLSHLLNHLTGKLDTLVTVDPTTIKVSSRSGHYAFTKTIVYPQKHVLAIPVGLACDQYGLFTNRCWVLERCDYDTGHWPISNPDPWLLARSTGKNTAVHPVTLSDFHRPFFTNPGDPRKATSEKRTAWRIVDKAPLLGCNSIQADGKSVTLLKRQRVWGSEFWHSKKLWPGIE